ncbi:MAG: exported protein [Chitinophagaceae bacterium]|nr:exported protein [Chitinophagaceae bacterium]
MKKLITLVCSVMIVSLAFAQPQVSFYDIQKSYPRVATAVSKKEDTLKKQFAKAGLAWPAKQIYIRSFKYDSQLEVWVRNNSTESYKLFKTYKVCALSGSLGPKRIEGDYQVPEGFYYINVFNPKSTFHLSLGINYPNASDVVLSDSIKPGGDIYIHGSCLTVGCIPIQDHQIEELYLLASHARNQGQDFIPVHIFPVRYNVAKSVDVLNKTCKEDADYQKFSANVKQVFDFFEDKKKLPLISVNSKGEYVIL